MAERCARACDRAGVEYAIIGGIAVGAYTVPRATKDADLVIALGKDDGARIDRLLGELVAEGFRVNQEAMRRRLARGPYLMTTWLGMTRADFMLKRPDAYWQSALDRRRIMRFDGRDLWFASPEDVVALKLVAARAQDIEDVKRILAVRRETLDRERMRSIVARFAANANRPELPADLERYLADADALPL